MCPNWSQMIDAKVDLQMTFEVRSSWGLQNAIMKVLQESVDELQIVEIIV